MTYDLTDKVTFYTININYFHDIRVYKNGLKKNDHLCQDDPISIGAFDAYCFLKITNQNDMHPFLG